MMKPDLKVTIAWGTETQLFLATKLKENWDKLRKQGYPVNAQMIFNDGDGMPITERAVKIFSDFDYAIFLFGVKCLDVTPIDGEMITILKQPDFNDMLMTLVNEEKGAISPALSQNIIYEIGIANATHSDPNSILWFSCGGGIARYFPADLNLPAVIPLDSFPDIDSQANKIMSLLHSKIRRQFDYLGESYTDTVPNMLSQRKYRPNLENIIARKNIIEIDFLGSYNSPLDAYFEKEYSLFDDENIQYNLDCRIQYFIDRAVLFVYLRNHNLWVQTVSKLADALERHSEKDKYYLQGKLAISILSDVMRYHKMMASNEVKPEQLYDSFNKNSLDNALENSMLRCLCFDYRGLCAHKVALEYLAETIGKKGFWSTSREDMKLLRISSLTEAKNKARHYLNHAVNSFDEVLRVSKEYSMESGYLWEGFAFYNRARCKYLLNALIPEGGYDWETDMDSAIRVRGEYADKYEGVKSFPIVITHNLRAEYYHARLEQFFYKIATESAYFSFSDFDKLRAEIKDWGKRSSFYTDVLQVTNKLISLEGSIEISPHEVKIAVERVLADTTLSKKLKDDLIELLNEAKEASLEGNEAKKKSAKDDWKWFLKGVGTPMEKVLGALSDLATIVSFFGITIK